MQIDFMQLPVYQQKNRILEALEKSQVIVVQSPTGSGKTTQLPIILHEAGYSKNGIIAVTQPRRIAALSVSEFISKQLGTTYPGLVGYKMRFEDKTDASTRIKIMTDGILLQEMKLDPWMSKYSVIMVDEAHERSLNIDFVLGLLKRILAERPDFKVIVSSATMNAEAFSMYFDGCPIVTIDTVTYPVTLVYDPPALPAGTATAAAEDALLQKIEDTIDRVLDNRGTGDILVFLPGEKVIKDCIWRLSHARFSRHIHLIPLYGRLAKEEQERVFDNAPFGRKKVIVSTNIAETSVTIPGITTVIDSGLAKMNFYNPRTYTSSLNETTVSKASCSQRKGRAGRIQAGMCYRLYSKRDYEARQQYTTEEIYRTDLSEVVLRMSELGITDFEQFNFISPPGHEGMRGAIETLRLLNALNDDNTLSPTGLLMARFPLMPRISRIIVEAIQRYPSVMEQVLIAAAFLSAQSPFVLPPGEETDARQAHHAFRDIQGDFVTYLKLYRQFTASTNKEKFCETNYLDQRVLLEIVNIKEQLELIVGDMGIPVSSSGNTEDYLTCIAAGLIQFVCIRAGRENYRSLTAEHIQIHPGSGLFKTSPLYIVAGEIVRTSRMFAMSVSPLTKNILQRLDGEIDRKLNLIRDVPEADSTRKIERAAAAIREAEKNGNILKLGTGHFEIKKIKGKRIAVLPWNRLSEAVTNYSADELLYEVQEQTQKQKDLRGLIDMNGFSLLEGEKFGTIIRAVKFLNLTPINEKNWNRRLNVHMPEDADKLADALDWILRVTEAKAKSRELGFICLFTDGSGNYWVKVSRGFATALNESVSSLETLVDESAGVFNVEQKSRMNAVLRKLQQFF